MAGRLAQARTEAEHVPQNPLQPARARGDVRCQFVEPLPQRRRAGRVDRRNAVREHALQDRERQERADGLDQRQPVVVDGRDGATSRSRRPSLSTAARRT